MPVGQFKGGKAKLDRDQDAGILASATDKRHL